MREEKPESLQRPRQFSRGVFPSAEFRRARQEILGATAPDIFFEDLIGIEQVADDQFEAAEVIDEFGRQLASACEKAGQLSRFNGANGFGVEAVLRERRDVRIAKNFKMRARKIVPQKFDRREREDEV